MNKETTRKATYYERLNILSTSIDHIKTIIKRNITNTIKCWESGKNIEKQTFHIIGPAGVGKTAICSQICNELSSTLNIKFQNMIIKGPVISRDDLLCPFPEIKDNSRKFAMLFSDFIPRDVDSYGLFVIDEFARADHNLQQLLWQIQNENKIHTYDFPKGWFIICLDNPDDEEYSMNYLEDAAGLRRSTHIYCELSLRAFLTHAKSSGFHQIVTDFIETNPNMLYDFESQRLGRVYSNPASWERASNVLWGYEMADGIGSSLNEIEIVLSGLLNSSTARVFIDFIRNNKVEIKPEDIFLDYKSTVKKKVSKLVSESNNARLGQVMNAFMSYLLAGKPQYSVKELNSIKDFLLDLPLDIATMYFTISHEIKEKDLEGFVYLTNMQSGLISIPEYKEKFYKPMVEISRKALGEKVR